jgi:hypothetical protein
MRKSLLTAIFFVALAGAAAPGFAAANTQQQQASGVEQPHCTAGSAKDVALARNRCG